MCMPSNPYTSRVERLNLIITLIESFTTRTQSLSSLIVLSDSQSRTFGEVVYFLLVCDNTKLTSQVSCVTCIVLIMSHEVCHRHPAARYERCRTCCQ